MLRFALGLGVYALTAWADGFIDPALFSSLPDDPNDPGRVQLRNIVFAEETARYGRNTPAGTATMTMTANGDHILVTFVAADGTVTGQRRIHRGAGSDPAIVPLGHTASGGTPILAPPDPANGSVIRVSGYQRVQWPAAAVGPDAQLRFSGSSMVVPTVKQAYFDSVFGSLATGATFGIVDARNHIVFYRKDGGALRQLYPNEVNLR